MDWKTRLQDTRVNYMIRGFRIKLAVQIDTKQPQYVMQCHVTLTKHSVVSD
jgi:hypothetical protein